MSRHGCLSVDPHGELIVDPAIGRLEALGQRNLGFPTEPAADQRIVTVSPTDALGGAAVIAALDLDSGDLFHRSIS